MPANVGENEKQTQSPCPPPPPPYENEVVYLNYRRQA